MIGGKYGCTLPSLRAVYGPELRNDLQQSAASKQGGFVETARVFISISCASVKSDMVNITQMAPRIFLSSQQGESVQRCEVKSSVAPLRALARMCKTTIQIRLFPPNFVT